MLYFALSDEIKERVYSLQRYSLQKAMYFLPSACLTKIQVSKTSSLRNDDTH